MAKNKKSPQKNERSQAGTAATASQQSESSGSQTLLWLSIIVGLTALCFYPMLSNQLTNWDDLFYVTNNKLLIGPDYKGIFSQPVVSNYHPFTILTLALNYQISQLAPFSYLLTNYLLHIINVVLVFLFIRRLSPTNQWVAFGTTAVFALHPMHVESVAWVSERKDVLYTMFFVLSLIFYWDSVTKNKKSLFALSMLFFVCSLLSKPAAIVLPLVLVLLDYYSGRGIDRKTILEKLPAFVLAAAFAIITLKIQSVKAVSSLDTISVGVRPLFASYAIMIYFVRAIVPYPLSAFHPYPPMDALGWPVYIAPVVVLVLAGITWIRRADKVLVFGMLFYVVNLLLVLQIVSFGNTIVSERYTYVPYIGLGFVVFSLASRMRAASFMMPAIAALVVGVFGYMTFERTKVWHDSATLWTDVISKYPYTAVPRTNRANHVTALAGDPAHAAEANAMNLQSLGDCDTALKVDPKHAAGYRIRGIVLLRLGRPLEAARDADSLKRLMPDDPIGYTIGGTANLRLSRGDAALSDINTSLRMSPEDAEMLNNRGTVLFNLFHKYTEAMEDFNHALRIRQDGNYYLNRSRCHYMLGNKDLAKEDVKKAMQLKTPVDKDYQNMVGM